MIKDRIRHYIHAFSRVETIRNLQPNSVLPVFHGSSHGNIYAMCLNGIDGRQRTHRLYPHYINVDGKSKMINRGLFVAPELDTALDFGRAIIKFKITAKYLLPPFPSPDMMRKGNNEMRDKYPNSFRPSLSDWLLGGVGEHGKQWNDNQGGERQGLYRGTTSPRAIEKVYVVDYTEDGKYEGGKIGKYLWSATPEKYIAWYEKHLAGRDDPDKWLFEPQENISVEEFINRIVKKYKTLKKERLEELISAPLSRADTFQKQIYAVMNLAGNKSMPFSFAKRMTPKLLKYFDIERKPGQPHETETYVSGR